MQELTQREQEIFDALIAGSVPKEIAINLHITLNTVKYHQKKLYQKLGVNSVNELLRKYSPEKGKDEAPAPDKAKRGYTLTNILVPAAVAAVTALVVLGIFLFMNDRPPSSAKTTADLAVNADSTVKPSAAGTPLAEPFPADFVLTLSNSWYVFEPDMFLHKSEWHPSPLKLGDGNRLVQGDIYQLTCSFTTDVDLDYIDVFFVEWEMPENIRLSGYTNLGESLKANTRYDLSTKILIILSASGPSPSQNQFHFTTRGSQAGPCTFTFHEFEVVKIGHIPIMPEPQAPDFASQGLDPLVITFAPIFENNIHHHWDYAFFPDEIFYEGQPRASPFKLGRGNRIVEGDVFLLTCSFTSDVDIDELSAGFPGINMRLRNNIKAGVEYSISTMILANQTARDTSPGANHFVMWTADKSEQPTLTFTQFEVIKIN